MFYLNKNFNKDDLFIVPGFEMYSINRNGEVIDKREETNKRKKSLSINYKIKKALPIEVTDLQTGETKVYNSSEEFSNILNVNKKTFQRHILYHNGVWKNKYKVKYLKDN